MSGSSFDEILHRSIVFCTIVYTLQALISATGVFSISFPAFPDFSGSFFSDVSSVVGFVGNIFLWAFSFFTFGIVEGTPWWIRVPLSTFCISALLIWSLGHIVDVMQAIGTAIGGIVGGILRFFVLASLVGVFVVSPVQAGQTSYDLDLATETFDAHGFYPDTAADGQLFHVTALAAGTTTSSLTLGVTMDAPGSWIYAGGCSLDAAVVSSSDAGFTSETARVLMGGDTCTIVATWSAELLPILGLGIDIVTDAPIIMEIEPNGQTISSWPTLTVDGKLDVNVTGSLDVLVDIASWPGIEITSWPDLLNASLSGDINATAVLEGLDAIDVNVTGSLDVLADIGSWPGIEITSWPDLLNAAITGSLTADVTGDLDVVADVTLRGEITSTLTGTIGVEGANSTVNIENGTFDVNVPESLETLDDFIPLFLFLALYLYGRAQQDDEASLFLMFLGLVGVIGTFFADAPPVATGVLIILAMLFGVLAPARRFFLER